MSVIERRIRRGDYLLRPLPSERKLAAEIGVSHMTARKAVKELLERNVLSRQPNGNLQISPDYHADAGAAQLILLYPAFASAYLSHLCQVVSKAAGDYGLSTRPVPYVHWDDPIVLSAMNNPGGVIVIPASLDMPEHILQVLQSNRVVSLDLDLSDKQIPSIRLFSDAHILSVLDHLLKLGHHHIDCISTHTHNPEIQRRIQLWSEWTYRNGVAGELHERAAASFTDPTPAAFDEMSAVLRRPPVKATCFVATTFPAAIGAVRACWELDRLVGTDISVCAMNIEAPARFMTPSITGLDTPDLAKVLQRCFEWFTSDKPWAGPLRLEPADPVLFEGESTGRPHRKRPG